MEFSSFLEYYRASLIGQLPDQSSVDQVPLDTMATKSDEQKKQSWFQKKRTAATEVVHRILKGEEEGDDSQKVGICNKSSISWAWSKKEISCVSDSPCPFNTSGSSWSSLMLRPHPQEGLAQLEPLLGFADSTVQDLGLPIRLQVCVQT